jgi:hypothetical protein
MTDECQERACIGRAERLQQKNIKRKEQVKSNKRKNKKERGDK